MKVLRRSLTRFFAAGWLAAALAAGLSARAQEESRSQLVPGLNTKTAGASKVKATTASRKKYSPFDDDAEAVPPSEVIEPNAWPTREVQAHGASQPHRHPQQPVGYGFGGVRPAAGVQQRQARMARAFQEDAPLEVLPAPGAPQGMGPPAEAVSPPSVLRGSNGQRVMTQPGGGPVMSGETFEGEVPFGGSPFAGQSGGCASCEGGGCADCGGGCYRDCFPCLFLTLQNLDLFEGVHGFTNSTNRGGTGSFGFHAGFNKGMPMPCLPCSNLSMQIGMAGVFSNFDGGTFAVTPGAGAPVLATTFENRNQVFFTTGIFRRVDWGLQGGVVVDYLHDDWYATLDMTQIRGEMSWVYPNCHELGFWFATSVNGDTQAGNVQVAGRTVRTVEGWEPADLYAFFYRYRFPETCGNGRFFGGFSGDGDGLLGGDFWLPVNNNWSFQAEYTYLIPRDTQGVAGNQNEAWNLGINVVWSPGACRNYGPNYDRPLLSVANNGNFIVKRRIPPSTP